MNSNRIWAFGTAIAIVAVLALGYLLGVQPMLNRLDAAKAELVTTQANNAGQQATLEVMKGQYEDLDELQDELEVLRISIPGTLDSDFVYSLFAGYSVVAGATIDSITIGEAQPYGVTSDGTPTVDGIVPVANLYTVPVTVSIKSEFAAPGLAFAAAMQRGPRLFLVTSFSSGTAEEGSDSTGGDIATITGYMFVLADPSAKPEDAANAFLDHPMDPEQFTKPLGGPRPTPTPTPTESATPNPSDTATPTPTPTSTTGP